MPQLNNYHCKLLVDEKEISSRCIVSLTIREWVTELLPWLELDLFEEGLIAELLPLKDGTIIHVEISNDPATTTTLYKADFALLDYHIAPVKISRTNVIKITAVLKADKMMFPIQNRAFRNKTSVKVVEQIAGETGLKFVGVPPSINSIDQMTWLQVNCNNYQFLNHVAKRAYVGDGDAVLVFTDINGEMHYSTLSKAIESTSMPRIARYDPALCQASNLTAEQDATLWYGTYNFVNTVGSSNQRIAYGSEVAQYENDGEPTIAKVVSDVALLSDLTFRGVGVGQIVHRETFGTNGNGHQNIFKAMVQNDYMLQSFFSYSVMIGANAAQEVRLLDVVDIVIPSVAKMPSNAVLSGRHLVGGIIHNLAKGSTYRKWVSLHRNGLNKVEENSAA